jgi:hypothetical protein
MEEYIQALRKQLKGFSSNEQDALIEEIRSHIDDGEEDPRMGEDREERRRKIISELGSPKDLGSGLKAIYRPNRLIDYSLIAIPFLFYPYLNSLYISLMPKYSWADVRLDVLIHLPLVAIGLWRRSAPLTLFWATLLISQLFIITGRLYWSYGIQTVFWSLPLLGLLVLAGNVVWKNRNDLLIVVFGLMPLAMCIVGTLFNTLSVIRPFELIIWRSAWSAAQHAAYGLLDRSLLVLYIHLRDIEQFYSVLALALFFLPSNREIRWGALAVTGFIMGLGHRYLLDYQYNTGLMAPWIYILWLILPLIIVSFGWWLDKYRRQQLSLAT